VEVTVEENFEPGVGPSAQFRRERASGGDRRFAPMVGDDEQGDSAADVRLEHAEQLFDLALESRPDVVNGGKKSAC